MENMQQSKQEETQSFGSYELPSILPYPKILTLDQVPEIKGQYVYVVEDYPDNGLAIMLTRHDDQVYLGVADWDGITIDFEKPDHDFYAAAHKFITEYSSKFVEMMSLLNIEKIMVYIAVSESDWTLVDLRYSLNKFYGPGMVRDLFSKIFPTQEVKKIVSLNEENLAAIKNGKGSYEGDLILKCSKFKTITRGQEMLPLYARVKR